MSAFVLYLVLGIAAAGGQESFPPTQAQPSEQKSVQPKLSAADVDILRAKAEEGDASAQFLLGQAYEYGNGVPHNDESAVKWYRRGADQQSPAAENRLGLMYRLGLGVNPDKAEAVRWYHKSAKLGNPQAMFNLGVSYYNGDGVPSDPTAAYAWFLLAQEAGNRGAADAVKRSGEEGGRFGTPDALQKIGAMYETGDELPQSYAEAAKWYRKATDLSPLAGVKLASMLIEGRGVPHDYSQALALCQKAAKSDYGPAQYCVGYLYKHGLGTRVDAKEAAKWYEQASKSGQRQAMTELATMYWKGDGVSMNRPEAYYFFFMAYEKGVPDAKTQAQELWKEMSKDDIKHLEKKLRELRLDPQKVFAVIEDQGTSGSSQR